MLVTMLRQLHPDDKRVIELQQKLGGTVAGATATSTAAAPQAAEARPAGQPAAAGLTVLERVQMNAIETLAREVAELPPGSPPLEEKSTDLLTRTKPLVEKYPGHLRLWAIRVSAALPLDDFDTGYEAGERILALAEKSEPDAKTMELLGDLELKGWLGEKGAQEKARRIAAESNRRELEAKAEAERRTQAEAAARAEAERKDREARAEAERRERAAKEAELWRNGGGNRAIADLGLPLIAIAPGTFQMGSEDGDPDEKPVTRVTLSRGFWLGKTEVTQAQWQALMGSNPTKHDIGENIPVTDVSWGDAMSFCKEERGATRSPEIAAAAKALDREVATNAEKMREERQRAFERREAELKVPVEVVKTGEAFALQRGGKRVASFPAGEFSNLRALEGTRFFVLTRKEGDFRESIVDGAGAVQTIGEDEKFSRVYGGKNGEVLAEVQTAKFVEVDVETLHRPDIRDETKFYKSGSEAESAVRRAIAAAEERLSESERRRREGSVTFAFLLKPGYGSVGLRRYTLGTDLSVEKKEEGFVVR